MKINPLTCIDFYKTDHRSQYPEGTNLVYSNFTARGDHHFTTKLDGIYDSKVVFFGLRYFIKFFLIDTFNDEFFRKDKKKVVARYKRRLDNALGKDSVSVDHIEDLHDLGYLPLEIRAVDEGECVNLRVPLLTIHNTVDEFFWLTNYIESVLSCFLWKPITSATIARQYRLLMDKYAEKTADDSSFVDFQAHDFSFRGMSTPFDAALSGAAHLQFFKGTDCVASIDLLEDYYDRNSDNELVGCSVPATEHSVMCMGSKDDEVGTFKRLITEIYPSGIVSIVSDTWNLWTVLNEYAVALKDEIMNRDGKIVFRPDSGDPETIICGDINAKEGSLEYMGCLNILAHNFGYTINKKGYKVLNPKVGLIYGDAITLDRANSILDRMESMGFSSENIVFGVGSYTYQHVTRDTFGFAMKATYGEINRKPVNIFKDPKTDDGLKKSAKGIVSVFKTDTGYGYKDECKSLDVKSELSTVFIDGRLKSL